MRKRISILNHPLVRKAALYARFRHRHQKRRTGAPYFIHPQAVARIVSKFTKDPRVVAAAYLHDTIEDTGADYEDLKTRFGERVARYVSLLSRDFRKPKAESLREYRRAMRKAPSEVKLIAAADAFHNANSPAEPAFMRAWFKKAVITLRAIEAGNLGTYTRAIQELAKKVRELKSEFER